MLKTALYKGAKINYERKGNAKRTVVLLHGFLENHKVWDDYTKVLAKTNTVYAIDLRGYGKTPRDKSGWNTPEQAAKDTSMVLDYIDSRHKTLKGTTVFGWSNGSLVGMLTAQKYPDKVKNLVLYGFPIDTQMTFEDSLTGQIPHKKLTTAEAAAEDFILPGTISKEAIDAYVKAALAADPVRAD